MTDFYFILSSGAQVIVTTESKKVAIEIMDLLHNAGYTFTKQLTKKPVEVIKQRT
jgi:hypothetical protein